MHVGQVSNLRPIFNRPRTGPAKFFGCLDDTGPNGIHLDIRRDALKLSSISNQTIVTLDLPERLSRAIENPIRFLRREPLQRLRQLRNLDMRRGQKMNMVRHHHVRMNLTLSQYRLAVSKCIDYRGCNFGHLKIQRPFASVIQELVHNQECFSVGCGRREAATTRKAAVETPSQKHRVANCVEVREPAGAKIAHQWIVPGREGNSQKISRPIENRPQVGNLPYIASGGGQE